MSGTAHDPENKPLEEALKSLQPLAGAFDRDRLMYRAGQASAPRRGWAWPALASVLALTSAGLAFALVLQPVPQSVERVIYVEVPAAPEEAVSPGDSIASPVGGSPAAVFGSSRPDPLAYAQLRSVVLRDGVDAMPRPARDSTRLAQVERTMTLGSDRNAATLSGLEQTTLSP